MSQEILQILGQLEPVAATETVLYTVPTGRRAAISSLKVVNNGAGNSLITISIVPGGANDIATNPTASVNTLISALSLAQHVPFPIDIDKMTLNENDDIRVEVSVIDVVFHVYGVEVIPDKI